MDQLQWEEAAVSRMMLSTYQSLGQQLFLQDESFANQLELGNVVSITRTAMTDQTSNTFKVFHHHFKSDSPIESLSFFKTGIDICVICKSANTEKILMANGDVFTIP